MNYPQDDLYEQIGLQNLLAGRNPPDIYFEWTGSRMAQRVRGRLRRGYHGGGHAPVRSRVCSTTRVFPSATVDGKVVMVPVHRRRDQRPVVQQAAPRRRRHHAADDMGRSCWPACDTLNAKGIIPIASGNKDLWAAGNFLAHMVSRVVGEDVYDATLGGTGKFDTPDWETGVRLHRGPDRPQVRQRQRQRDRRQRGRAAVLPGQGRDAPHRLVAGRAGPSDDGADLDFDFVNWPAMPEARRATRAASSVSRPATSSTPRAPRSPRAVDFLALRQQRRERPGVHRRRRSRRSPSRRRSVVEIDSRSARLNDLLSRRARGGPAAGHRLRPEDGQRAVRRGGGRAGRPESPEDALAGIDQQLGR